MRTEDACFSPFDHKHLRELDLIVFPLFVGDARESTLFGLVP